MGLGGWTGIPELALGFCFGFLAPVFSGLGFVYLSFLIGLGIYFVKAELLHPYIWGGGVSVIGLSQFLLLFGLMSRWEGALTVGIWLVLMAGVFFFGRVWLGRVRYGADQHLMALSQEHLVRRMEIERSVEMMMRDKD